MTTLRSAADDGSEAEEWFTFRTGDNEQRFFPVMLQEDDPPPEVTPLEYWLRMLPGASAE